MSDTMLKIEKTIAEMAVIQKETKQTLKETQQTLKELAEVQKETDARIAKSREETDARIANSIEELRRELTAQNQEMERKFTAQNQEMERKLTSYNKELKDTLNKWIGRFGTDMGTLVELTLIPGIKKKMRKFGHDFVTFAARKQYYRKGDTGNMLAEIDLLLENGVEVMAVEVKTKFNKSAVEYHVNRLKLLRKHDAERLKGKAILGAVAGLEIDKDAAELASQLGMYIIKMVEDDKNIKVIEPAGAVGKW